MHSIDIFFFFFRISDHSHCINVAKHCPKDITDETLKRMDSDTRCSGYMTMPQFDKLLQGLDEDMQRQGRKIALLIDSAPGHGGGENIGLRNITLVRLPPGITSVTQPMDAGVIRSFKVLYSQEMLEILCRIREQERSPKAAVQYGTRWTSLVDAWDKVSPDC